MDFSNSILDLRFYRDQDHLNEDGLKILEKLIVTALSPKSYPPFSVQPHF